MQCNTDPCPCPIEKPEYFEVRGKCFYTDNTTRNFDDSQAHCKEIFPHGGRLYEPRDKSTNKEVAQASHRASNWVWIGITDRSSQGSYQYSSDDGTLTISQWAADRPSNDNEDCGVFCTKGGSWCDAPCSDEKYYVCE